MDAPLTIRLFGPMHVRIGDAPLPRVRSRKALWLLALLATRPNRPVAREWIASTLWPDVDLVTAFSNLRPVLSELRNALGEHRGRIRSFDRSTVDFDLTAVDLDLARFDASILEGDFAQAIELYRGPFLEGCNEEWAPQERTAREVECLRALELLGERAIETEDYEGALGYFSRAIAIDAWRDAPRRGLMLAFAAKGDVNAGLHVYREFANFLSAKAALEPDQSTTELYERLRASAKRGGLARSREGRSDPVWNDLPCPLCELKSREREIRFDVGVERSSLQHRLALSRIYCFDEYRFMPERQLLLRGGLRVQVGARALDLLHLLVQRVGELVGKDELIRYCWPDTYIHENNLMVNIAALRRALPHPADLPYIVTVPGRGYRFVAPLRIETRSMLGGSTPLSPHSLSLAK